jgi:hypothetical protein
VPESRLLRRFFPDARETLAEGVTIKLFRYHFLLYHHLYRLAEELEKNDSEFFLYIKTINVYLLRKPAAGHCCYFDETKPGFCGMKIDGAAGSGRYCSFHRKLRNERIGGGTVTDPDARGFYLDLKNMEEMDEQKLKMWQNGILTYAASHEEIERSLKLLSLPPDYSIARLKNRYRYLCKRYHPDTAGPDSAADGQAVAGHAADGDPSVTIDFKEIHRAYQTLLALAASLH